MNIGDIVKPTKESEFTLRCGSGWYDDAVVISITPFILTSTDSNMMWEATIKKEYFEVVGKIDEKVLSNCMRRLNKKENEDK